MSVYETLIEKGYYKGNLAELNPDMDLINEISKKLYSYLENKEQHFYFFNIYSDSLEHVIPYSQREERLKLIEFEGRSKTQYNNRAQILIPNQDIIEYKNYFYNLVKVYIKTIYPDLTDDNFDINSTMQMYQNGDFQNAHHDGHIGTCVVLIYLSDPSTYNNSGKLELVDETWDLNIIDSIDPVLGNFIILDLSKNNLRHRVEEVTGDFVRFSSLCQVRKA